MTNDTPLQKPVETSFASLGYPPLRKPPCLNVSGIKALTVLLNSSSTIFPLTATMDPNAPASAAPAAKRPLSPSPPREIFVRADEIDEAGADISAIALSDDDELQARVEARRAENLQRGPDESQPSPTRRGRQPHRRRRRPRLARAPHPPPRGLRTSPRRHRASRRHPHPRRRASSRCPRSRRAPALLRRCRRRAGRRARATRRPTR